MLIMWNKGLTKLKLKIHRMKNNMLVSEWQTIRLINSKCIPNDILGCSTCNFARCLCYLIYEEIVTKELHNRGLFDFAANNCLKHNIAHICEF
ncbi:MAG: hypothetical protein FK732_04725 [Asgard group archaeon]|nr:hypothetical protein [Asgard group archaeon]